MILVASRSIFSLFNPDEETFASTLLWKNLLRTCSTLLLEGERGGRPMANGTLARFEIRPSRPSRNLNAFITGIPPYPQRRDPEV